MRLSSVLALASAATALGCVVRLDDEFLPDGATNVEEAGVGAADGGAPPVATGCALLPGVPGVRSLAGDSHSLVSSDGGTLWIVDQAVTSDGGAAFPAAIVVAPGASADCNGWSPTFEGTATAPSPLEDGGAISPLDLVATSSGPALYYEVFAHDPAAPLGLRALGTGITSSAADGTFIPTSDLLWTPDRPNYGGSALRMGDTVFVWGCKSTGAFEADCFVAQASAANLHSASAYTYWAGDRWSSNPDDATPITSAGGVVSVRPDPSRGGRLLMTYVPPLGDALVIRSAMAPQGPWSAPIALAACDLAGTGSGSFCSGGQQHPELVTGTPDITLTYDARTFAADAGSAAAFWPRLVTIPVPAELP
jgi:hypothetical protein